MSVEPNQKASSKKKREKRPPKKITERYLYNSGLYYLQQFASSKQNFKTVMKRKVKRSCLHHKDQDYDSYAKMVDDLADQFEEQGLLNDDAYIRGMVTSLRRRGLSSRAIVTRMKHKGIESDKTQTALETHDLESCESARDADILAALTYCRKKRIGPFFEKQNKEEVFEKWLASLGRQGYSYDTARSVLEYERDDAQDALSRLR